MWSPWLGLGLVKQLHSSYPCLSDSRPTQQRSECTTTHTLYRLNKALPTDRCESCGVIPHERTGHTDVQVHEGVRSVHWSEGGTGVRWGQYGGTVLSPAWEPRHVRIHVVCLYIYCCLSVSLSSVSGC